MELAPSPKHLGSLDNADKRVLFPSLQSGDVAAWIQAGIMAPPFLEYAFVYILRRFAYSEFSVSTTLITVKLEVILWLGAGLMLPFVVILLQWVFSTYASMDRVATTVWFVDLLLPCAFFSLTMFTLTLSHGSGLFDWLHYMCPLL